MSRELTSAVIAVYEQAGCKTRIEHGGKHIRVFWSHPDCGESFQTCAATESDWRAVKNEVALAKRLLREAGIIGEAERENDAPVISLFGGQPVCSSREIAERFSKAHKDVLRSIDRVRSEVGAEFDQRNFAPITYTDTKGREFRAFNLTRDGFSLVAMGFTGAEATKWKVRYIEAFGVMERELEAVRLPAISSDVTLRADLEALTEIVLSLPMASPTIERRKGPFVNPVFAIRQRRAERRARRCA